ncbi:MAG: hypothetical protein ACJ786_17050 [Catenulispora sp.]
MPTADLRFDLRLLVLMCRRPCCDRRPHEALDGLLVAGVGPRLWDELDSLLPEEPGVWGASPPARELGVLGMLRMIAALAKPATTPRLPDAQLWVAPWPQNRGGETEVWFVRNGDSVYALFPF